MRQHSLDSPDYWDRKRYRLEEGIGRVDWASVALAAVLIATHVMSSSHTTVTWLASGAALAMLVAMLVLARSEPRFEF